MQKSERHLAIVNDAYWRTLHLLDGPLRVNACDINVTYTLPKSAFSGLQFRRWQYGSISIRLAVIGVIRN